MNVIKATLVFICCLMLASLMAGCATPSTVRTFPQFVAVIVQPGDTLASLAEKYLNDASREWQIAEFNEINTITPGQKIIIPLKSYEKGGLTTKGYQTVPVLSYQRLSTSKADDRLAVTKDAFEEQMQYLKDNGYRVITTEQLFRFMDLKESIPQKAVVITIDDDWRSVYDIAFPILKKFDYPATLFLDIDSIADTKNPPSWDMIKEMNSNGVDIQCQSKTLGVLLKPDRKERFNESFADINNKLTLSKNIIKTELNDELEYLAYPLSEPDMIVSEILRKYDFRGGFALKDEGNPFFAQKDRISRFAVSGSVTLRSFPKNLPVFRREVLAWK